jgi:hypothetical protein
VITAPVPPPLASQLGLAEGFGILVEEVMPDSPAATAGLQKFDVLKLLDDQRLMDPNQLAVLIRSYGKDHETSLTLLRKGQEQKVALKIGERMLPERQAFIGSGSRELFSRMEGLRDRDKDGPGRSRGDNSGFEDRVRDFQKKLEVWRKNPGDGPAPQPPMLIPQGKPSRPEIPGEPNPAAPKDGPGGQDGPARPPAPPRPDELLREGRPGGAPQVRIDQNGDVTTWNTGEARIVVKDSMGEIRVMSVDGHRTVVAKNPAGETIFDGPVDTEEQRNTLPPPVRHVLDHIQKQRFGQDRPKSAAAGDPDASDKTAPLAAAEREIQ